MLGPCQWHPVLANPARRLPSNLSFTRMAISLSRNACAVLEPCHLALVRWQVLLARLQAARAVRGGKLSWSHESRQMLLCIPRGGATLDLTCRRDTGEVARRVRLKIADKLDVICRCGSKCEQRLTAEAPPIVIPKSSSGPLRCLARPPFCGTCPRNRFRANFRSAQHSGLYPRLTEMRGMSCNSTNGAQLLHRERQI